VRGTGPVQVYALRHVHHRRGGHPSLLHRSRHHHRERRRFRFVFLYLPPFSNSNNNNKIYRLKVFANVATYRTVVANCMTTQHTNRIDISYNYSVGYVQLAQTNRQTETGNRSNKDKENKRRHELFMICKRQRRRRRR